MREKQRYSLKDWQKKYPKLKIFDVKWKNKVTYLRIECPSCHKKRCICSIGAYGKMYEGKCKNCYNRIDWKTKYPREVLDVRYGKPTTVFVDCPKKSLSCRGKRWIRVDAFKKSKGLCKNCSLFKGGYINQKGYKKISVNGKLSWEHLTI